MRIVWGIGGVVALALGLIGVALPILPTVPFILLAAYCFSNSSERLHDWILAHNIFGPIVLDWRETGAISLYGRRIATISIVAVLAISLALGLRPAILGIQAIILSCVLLFIWTRPTGSSREPDTTRPADRESDTE